MDIGIRLGRAPCRCAREITSRSTAGRRGKRRRSRSPRRPSAGRRAAASCSSLRRLGLPSCGTAYPDGRTGRRDAGFGGATLDLRTRTRNWSVPPHRLDVGPDERRGLGAPQAPQNSSATIAASTGRAAGGGDRRRRVPGRGDLRALDPLGEVRGHRGRRGVEGGGRPRRAPVLECAPLRGVGSSRRRRPSVGRGRGDAGDARRRRGGRDRRPGLAAIGLGRTLAGSTGSQAVSDGLERTVQTVLITLAGRATSTASAPTSG